jgi:hypothetical protein
MGRSLNQELAVLTQHIVLRVDLAEHVMEEDHLVAATVGG